MAAEFDWTSAVGDLDPAVLAIQLNDGPKIAGEIMDKIHNTLDRQDRYRAIQLFAGSLGRQSAETMARVCEEPEGLQHVLIGIVSANFFCGHPKEDFLGPYADLSKAYTYFVLHILNRSTSWLAAGLQTQPRPILQQSAQETLVELNPVWDRLAQFAPASGWYSLEPNTDFPNTLFAFPATCAAKVGLKIVSLYDVFRRLNPTPALNNQLISLIVHAFCLGLPDLIMNEFNSCIAEVLGLSSEQERRAIITEVFSNEIMAHMFFKAYCEYLSANMNPPKSVGDSSTTREIKLTIVQVLYNFVCDGPEVVLRALSSPGTIEKILTCTMYAGQWVWCHDELETSEYFLSGFLKTIRAMTRPVFIRRQYMQHQVSLDARTSHILLCHCAHGLSVNSSTDDLVALLDCIDIYGMPGAKGDISTLRDNRRHDFSNLRQIIQSFLRDPGKHLSEQADDLRLRAERTMHRMAQELVPDWSFVDSYTARPHRCSCYACICSGMKAPHKLRICQGCFSMFYCNRRCQQRDWEAGRHKEICRGRAGQG